MGEKIRQVEKKKNILNPRYCAI